MGCPLSFSLLFTYCSWEVTEQIRRAVLTPERTHLHSSGLFLLFSIFQTPAFLLITCKFKCIKHLKISRNTEVQDNILMPWKPSKYGDYLNLEGSWLTFRSASPKRNVVGSSPIRDAILKGFKHIDTKLSMCFFTFKKIYSCGYFTNISGWSQTLFGWIAKKNRILLTWLDKTIRDCSDRPG